MSILFYKTTLIDLCGNSLYAGKPELKTLNPDHPGKCGPASLDTLNKKDPIKTV
jgi:hypothetical protein